MDEKNIQAAYERLAMLHTETMAELHETRKRMDTMSSNWWWMFKHWAQCKLRMKSRWNA